MPGASMIPTLTLPFSRGGDTVATGSTRFPLFEKGRVRVGIHEKPVGIIIRASQRGNV